MRSFTQKLAEFATTTAFEDISAEARSMVQLSLIDWAACARAGLGDPVAAILRAQAMEEGGAPQAGLVGGGAVPARMAALANGTIGRAAEFDDLCLGTGIHPSASVVPAALAVAQKTGADARSFQTACAVGMEGAMRMGMWLTASASGGETAYPPFDLTGISGGAGAVLAAAHLLQLTAVDTQFALALVMDRARGAAVEAGAMGPAYDAGLAASYGVEAAGLAAQGGAVAQPALNAVPTAPPSAPNALASLGAIWMVAGISHRFHACDQGIQPALLALQDLLPLRAEDLRVIEVVVHPRRVRGCADAAPMTGSSARYSIPTVLAMAILGYDTTQPARFSDATCADPAVQALRAKVRVRVDPTTSETAARLRVQSRKGLFEASHDMIAPLDLAQRKAQVLRKAGALVGDERAAALWLAVDGLQSPDNFAALLT